MITIFFFALKYLKMKSVFTNKKNEVSVNRNCLSGKVLIEVNLHSTFGDDSLHSLKKYNGICNFRNY